MSHFPSSPPTRLILSLFTGAGPRLLIPLSQITRLPLSLQSSRGPSACLCLPDARPPRSIYIPPLPRHFNHPLRPSAPGSQTRSPNMPDQEPCLHPVHHTLFYPFSFAQPLGSYSQYPVQYLLPLPTSVLSRFLPYDIVTFCPPTRAARRTIVNKFKSIFKSTSPQPSPVIQSKPILKSINARLRRKPVARTEPYGPPWNAPMPVPESTLSPTQVVSPSPNTSRKRSLRQNSLPEKTPMSPGQLSPRTFINQLDEKLSLLQQQRIKDPIPSPRP